MNVGVRNTKILYGEKSDIRLNNMVYSKLLKSWDKEFVLRTDYERRQALIEIDVLTSMVLGITLEELKSIYRIQFPVLQSYEEDTWYDINGKIIFTVNRRLNGVGIDKKKVGINKRYDRRYSRTYNNR